MTKIEINRRFIVEIDKIFKVSIKKWGTVWVYFLDDTNHIKIAKLYQPLGSFLTHLNYLRISIGKEKINIINE